MCLHVFLWLSMYDFIMLDRASSSEGSQIFWQVSIYSLHSLQTFFMSSAGLDLIDPVFLNLSIRRV